MDTTLERTLLHFRYSKSRLARELGLTPQAVSFWKTIPAKHALRIEELTGGRVTAVEILKDYSQRHAA